MSAKRTLWDHYLDAIRLLARADVHLEFLATDVEILAEKAGLTTQRMELTTSLRADIATYLKKKAPSQ